MLAKLFKDGFDGQEYYWTIMHGGRGKKYSQMVRAGDVLGAMAVFTWGRQPGCCIDT